MNPNAELYSNNNDCQKEWASRTLSSLELKQRAYKHVLDIGCGTGEVTNVLLNRINDVENLIAFDKLESMVKFARSENPNPKIEYVIADVTKPESFSPEWRQKFDLITAFLVFHWTPNQYSNLETIKSLLAPKGEVIILLLTAGTIEYMSEVAKLEKWSHYFEGYTAEWAYPSSGWEEFSDWRFPDEVTGYRRMAESLGFTVKQCTNSFADVTFPDIQSAKRWFCAILPQVNRIPESRLPEFMHDAVDMYTRKYPVDENGKLHSVASAIAVHLHKTT
ncbi:trans-aconitate 2-methyltransferase-like [Tubulanus polymorphus]|uniref:trans-aconitate 2-methyltransferase-like n=1 Tax=Tubulanus polymorphus TaxID=672921 RepID=UPI003DA62E3D